MGNISQVVVGVSGFDVVEQIVHGPTGMCIVSTEQAKKEDRPPHSSSLVRLDFLGPGDMKSPSTGKRNLFRPSAAKAPPRLPFPNRTSPSAASRERVFTVPSSPSHAIYHISPRNLQEIIFGVAIGPCNFLRAARVPGARGAPGRIRKGRTMGHEPQRILTTFLAGPVYPVGDYHKAHMLAACILQTRLSWNPSSLANASALWNTLYRP